MSREEARKKIAEAMHLLAYIDFELKEGAPCHIVVSTLSLAARTALRQVTDQFGAALELDT